MINNIRKKLIKLLVGDMPVCMNYELVLFNEAKAITVIDPKDNCIFDNNLLITDCSDSSYQMTPILQD
jgi:hypothetical protein